MRSAPLLSRVITCDNIGEMSSLKLQKIGNSLGFRIPKETLDHLGFQTADQYELMEEDGVLLIVKRPPPSHIWTFREPELTKEDHEWLEADLSATRKKKKPRFRK